MNQWRHSSHMQQSSIGTCTCDVAPPVSCSWPVSISVIWSLSMTSNLVSVAVAWCLCQWRHISCLVHVSVTSHLVSVSEEWRWCQLMVVMICAPQTVSAYNLVGITFVRFLAVRKTVDVKKVQLHVASGTDVVPCLCSVELQNIYDAEPTFSLSCTSHHLYLKNIVGVRTRHFSRRLRKQQ